MQNPSALLWRLGVALGEQPSLETPLYTAPASWISENTKQITGIIEQFQCILLIDGEIEVERMLFPRLTLYMCGRSKFIEGPVEQSVDVIHFPHDHELTSTRNIARLSPEAINEYLRKCIANPVKLGYSETEHVNALYCLDILTIAARALVGFSRTEKISDLQNLTDLLQELLDFGSLGDLRLHIIATLLDIFDKFAVSPRKMVLKGVTTTNTVSAGTVISERASKGGFNGKDIATKLIKASVRDVLLWRQVNHPNVLSVYGLDKQYSIDNYMCLVSPWMSCGNIIQYLDSNPAVDRISLVHDIACGLRYLHNFKPPIVHGNLTVENILISDSLRACITNFMIAPTSSVRVQTTENIEGVYYSNASLGFAEDVYAFSTVFYQVLVKRPGFIGPCLGRSNKWRPSDFPRPFLVDDFVWKLMQRCWSLEPGSRHRMSEVVDSLSRYLTLSSSAYLGLDGSFRSHSVIRSLRPSVFDLADLFLDTSNNLPTLLKEDATHNANPNDIIIVVTGPSGSGKSSFINQVFGCKVAEVHDELESCTQTVRAFGCMHPHQTGQKVIIVDTPGFDDSNRTDFEILEELAQWLENTYRRKILVSGILQFHSIRDPRMRGAPRRNLAMFQQLCGRDAFKNVVLLTTFWDQVLDVDGVRRERELQEKFWEPLIAYGSRVDRFNPPNFEHAWDIIDQFPPAGNRAALTIQIEMGDQNKKLYETSVFKVLSDFWTSLVNALTGKSHNAEEVRKETERACEQQQAFEKHRPNSPASSVTLKKKWFQSRCKGA